MGKILLDINTLAEEKNQVRIDGTLYDMLEPADFGIAEQGHLTKLFERIRKVGSGVKSLEARDEKAAEASLWEFISKIMPSLPKEVYFRMKPGYRTSIVDAFMDALGEFKKGLKPEEGTEAEG